MIRTTERRVVITGASLVCPLGSELETVWSALQAGQSGVRPATSLPGAAYRLPFTAESTSFKGEMEDFGPLDPALKKTIRKALKVMCREIQMGVAVAQRALAAAGQPQSKVDPERIGVSFGCDYLLSLPEEFNSSIQACTGPQARFEFNRWAGTGLPQMQPLWLLKYLPNMPAAHVAIFNDLRGPNNSITLREASANLAVGEAFRIIARGHADVMLAGATGTRVHPMKSLHVVQSEELADPTEPSEKVSRPFDKHRTGMVLGEGAGCLVLESLESAEARGAPILAEVLGFASSAVGNGVCIANRKQALFNAGRNALKDATLQPRQLGHVHAHGLSTRSCDLEEAQALNQLLGEALSTVPVTASKSYFGNLGAGSGLVELINSVQALQHGPLFPLLNYTTPDPACPLRAARSGDLAGDSCLNLNVTPQGQAAALVVGKWSGRG